jgi:hypothetical protein
MIAAELNAAAVGARVIVKTGAAFIDAELLSLAIYVRPLARGHDGRPLRVSTTVELELLELGTVTVPGSAEVTVRR